MIAIMASSCRYKLSLEADALNFLKRDLLSNFEYRDGSSQNKNGQRSGVQLHYNFS